MTAQFEHPDYQQIKRELTLEKCPLCHASNFDLKIEFQSGEEGIYLAQCLSCDHIFVISTLTRRLILDDPKIEEKLDGMSCPSCQHQGAVMHFRCDLNVKECFYYVGCPNCGKTHQEYR